jgi:hypothetical protein
MLYKAISVAHLTGSQRTAPSVEIFEVQRSIPSGTIQPSEDFRRAIEQSPADVREAFREVMAHEK